MKTNIYKEINKASEALTKALIDVKNMAVFLELIKKSIRDYKEHENTALHYFTLDNINIENTEEDKIRALFKSNRQLKDMLFLELIEFNKNIINVKDL